MLADFYISRLSNNMKIAVQKNHIVLGGLKLLYTILPPKLFFGKFANILFFSIIEQKFIFGIFFTLVGYD